jgi:hypothetical protein
MTTESNQGEPEMGLSLDKTNDLWECLVILGQIQEMASENFSGGDYDKVVEYLKEIRDVAKVAEQIIYPPIAIKTENHPSIGVLFACLPGERQKVVRDTIEQMSSSDRQFALMAACKKCRRSVTYFEIEDIPLVNVPCGCGGDTGYLIKFEDLE